MLTPIQNIGQIAVNTQDLQRAVVFYRDALGLAYLFETGPLAFFSAA
ncbi:MAG: VOC family protein [Actinomycetota bacterium]